MTIKKKKAEKIIRASTKGPKVMCAQCKDIIQSKHVHDMVRCKCGTIGIDGGSAYTRCSGNFGDFVWDYEKTK